MLSGLTYDRILAGKFVKKVTMAEQALYSGPAVRRLRKRLGLTQAAMAQRLGISPTYLNLIERNQRPLSARVLLSLTGDFDLDPRALGHASEIGGVDGLARRFADRRFAQFGIDREEIVELLSAAPQAAAAFAALYDAAGEGADAAGGLSGGPASPLVTSRREIERWNNHFADLDHAAEALADELRLSRGELAPALAERLRERHQLTVRVLPQEVMPDALRRLDLHARQVQLSEMLGPSARTFQVALQIARLEARDEIAGIVAGSNLADEAARRFFERHLLAYFAAALLMPYRRFLRACEATGYDLDILRHRFGVSFEQLAHRLTTLQRVGERGLPFFMARFDQAGQISKRFAGASGATFLEGEASCPLWKVHQVFARPDDTLVQPVRVDGVTAGPAHWLTISRRTLGGPAGQAQFAVVLGLEARLAEQCAFARGVMLRADEAMMIGQGCSQCRVAGCAQRALPPRGAQLQFTSGEQWLSPFRFA